MTAYKDGYDDMAFMAELMLGVRTYTGFQTYQAFWEYEQLFDKTQHLSKVVRHIRKQLILNVNLCRNWNERHKNIWTRDEQRYSALEGMLCYQDLQQHWALYRRAMREMHETHRQAKIMRLKAGQKKMIMNFKE